MIGLFTNPNDLAFIRVVEKAASTAAPEVPFRVYDLTERPESRALESREFLTEILGLDACVIDGDQRSMVSYAAEFGSLAAGMSYWVGRWGRDRDVISDLDRRILLLTRQPRDKTFLFRYFETYYTIFSLVEIPQTDQVNVLTQWLRETLDRSAPKVFVSHRSSAKDFARKVAESLKRRGAVVWFDEISIKPGDSIPEVINRGLGWCTHMVLIIDETFFDSDWTKAEYESVLYRHLSGGRHTRQTSERALISLLLVDPASEKCRRCCVESEGLTAVVRTFEL